MKKPASPSASALGLDFGTESVRALLVDLRGRERGSAVARYRHGQIVERLPGTDEKLPPGFALQHPQDWIDSAARAVRAALRTAKATAGEVVGLGVDFTSCTMLPARADGTPLCLTPKFAGNKYAWPKLWKHHAAQSQTDRLNFVARERGEPWLSRYGGTVGLEWFFPKVLETLERAPKVYAVTEVWLEAGDWFVWQLVGGPACDLPRSTCQAGYKGLWSRKDGFPSQDFFAALHPKLENVVAEKMPGRFVAPGAKAGGLTSAMAKKLGLRAGTPVSAATIDAHAGVPGCGAAEAGVLVMVMGTSSCHMLNGAVACATMQCVPGVAGIVEDGILPGFIGYETGQAAVGDAFDWLRRITGHADFTELTAAAAKLPPGAEGVLCLDWFNGCRTPLMDGSLSGGFSGLTLGHGAAHLYRALLEASAFGLKWIVDLLREHGVPVKRFIATGGLPHHNPLLVQICADVLGESVAVHPSEHGPALGAAILGALAAGPEATGFRDVAGAIRAMASPPSVRRATRIVKPRPAAVRAYATVYPRYRAWADTMGNRKDQSK
jgi:L-ribulokinase